MSSKEAKLSALSNVECESFDKLGQRAVWERASISFWESLGLPFIWARTKARDLLLFKVKNIYIFTAENRNIIIWKFCGVFLIIFFDSMWRYRYANLDNFGDYSALVLALETILPQTKTGTAWAHTPFWLEFDFLNLLSLEIRFLQATEKLCNPRNQKRYFYKNEGPPFCFSTIKTDHFLLES